MQGPERCTASSRPSNPAPCTSRPPAQRPRSPQQPSGREQVRAVCGVTPGLHGGGGGDLKTFGTISGWGCGNHPFSRQACAWPTFSYCPVLLIQKTHFSFFAARPERGDKSSGHKAVFLLASPRLGRVKQIHCRERKREEIHVLGSPADDTARDDLRVVTVPVIMPFPGYK